MFWLHDLLKKYKTFFSISPNRDKYLDLMANEHFSTIEMSKYEKKIISSYNL